MSQEEDDERDKRAYDAFEEWMDDTDEFRKPPPTKPLPDGCVQPVRFLAFAGIIAALTRSVNFGIVILIAGPLLWIALRKYRKMDLSPRVVKRNNKTITIIQISLVALLIIFLMWVRSWARFF